MGSIGEIMAEVTHAEVVTHEQTVMYDDELLSDIKCLTVEELYVRLDKELEQIDETTMKYSTQLERKKLITERLQKKKLEYILCYLCELYRRNMNDHFVNCPYCKWWEIYDIEETPDDRYGNKYETFWSCFSTYKQSVKNSLKKLRKIKEIQLASLKQPRMYQEINDLMDEILDANGNKISEFKDYLTPEHYRLIRSGIDVKEIKEPDVLLDSLRKMKPKGK